MTKIAIDLLPIEFRAEDLKKSKFVRVQTIGVAIIMLMVFLSSLTVALRILQSQQISQVEAKLSQSQEKVSNLKETQASLVLLKNRLTTIDQYLGNPSSQSKMYKLITKLLPPSVTVSSISVERTGDTIVLATAPNGETVDNIVDSLTSQKEVKTVSIETISRGKDGIYRLTFKVTPK